MPCLEAKFPQGRCGGHRNCLYLWERTVSIFVSGKTNTHTQVQTDAHARTHTRPPVLSDRPLLLCAVACLADIYALMSELHNVNQQTNEENRLFPWRWQQEVMQPHTSNPFPRVCMQTHARTLTFWIYSGAALKSVAVSHISSFFLRAACWTLTVVFRRSADGLSACAGNNAPWCLASCAPNMSSMTYAHVH